MKTDGRKLSPSAQEALRIRAVRAVVRGGQSQSAVARTMGLSRQHVNQWVGLYHEGGWPALKAQKRGPKAGTVARLKGWQAAAIVNLILDRTPDQLRLAFALWTREAVAELIKERFAIRLSLSTMGRYLRKWGFTPQKPLRRAFERDEKAVARWLKTAYPAIRREAKREGAEIHWGDEMGLRSDHQSGTSYSPKGQTPVIPGTGKRFSRNVISTVTNRGTLRFMVFRQSFKTEVYLKFLRRLVRGERSKIFLIVDNHPVHLSAASQRWIEQHSGRIRVFYLPGYSPELNPDEYLNNDVKSNAVGRRRAANEEELERNVRGYLRGTQRRPQIVRNYFRAAPVRYAAHE